MTLSAQERLDRRHYVGCSDIPAILGISPFKSSYALACEKRGLVDVIDTPDERMTAGHYMEEGIVAYARGELGLDVRPADDAGCQHPDFPFIRGHVDRLIFEGERPVGILECKNVDWQWRDLWDDGVPSYYQSQSFGYTGLMSLPLTLLACFGGNHFERFEIAREHEIEENQFRTVAAWWTNIHQDRMPDVDGSADTTEALKRRFRRHTADMIEGGEAHLALAVERVQRHAAKKAAEDALADIDNRIRELIGDAAGITLPDGGNVTWKRNKDSMKLDADRLADEYPDVFSICQKTVEGPRVLRVSPKAKTAVAR